MTEIQNTHQQLYLWKLSWKLDNNCYPLVEVNQPFCALYLHITREEHTHKIYKKFKITLPNLSRWWENHEVLAFHINFNLTLWPLFMDGVQLSQGYTEPLRAGGLLFPTNYQIWTSNILQLSAFKWVELNHVTFRSLISENCN